MGLGTGLLKRLASWVKTAFAPREKVVKRYALPQPRGGLPSSVVSSLAASSKQAQHTQRAGREAPASLAEKSCPPTGPTAVTRPPSRSGCADHVTDDEIAISIDGLLMSVRRKIDLDIPFEVTAVVPRAEIIETYADGKLVQRTRVYSSITIAHSPRFEGLGRQH